MEKICNVILEFADWNHLCCPHAEKFLATPISLRQFLVKNIENPNFFSWGFFGLYEQQLKVITKQIQARNIPLIPALAKKKPGSKISGDLVWQQMQYKRGFVWDLKRNQELVLKHFSPLFFKNQPEKSHDPSFYYMFSLVSESWIRKGGRISCYLDEWQSFYP